MREIEFRVWDKDTSRMTYPDEHGWYERCFKGSNGCLQTVGLQVLIRLYNNECIQLMEYAGLKDKNDKKIYEGDIIRFKNNEETIQRNEHGDGIYKIEFAVSSFVAVNDEDEIDFGHYYLEEGKGLMEVIGNIYENQELMPV